MRNSILKALALGAALSAVPALAATPDGVLTSKAKLSLWTTAGIKSTAVHVDTNDGVVTLYGKVPNVEQRALAEKTVREASDVRGVKNLLQVVPGSEEKYVARDDKEIQAAAEKQLKADPYLKDSSISVKSVDKGLVLLSGEAKSFSDHVRAVGLVDRIPGVRRVASEVKGPEGVTQDERIVFINSRSGAKAKHVEKSSTSDARISASVKLRLLTASNVPSTEISVDTEDGVVTLFGMVPTAEVKNVAAAEAGKVDGVTHVANQLEVVPSSRKQVVEAKDDDITRDLGLVFKDRPEFKSVNTAVKNGTVRLTGNVGSAWDEVNAVRMAREVAGVRHVEDQLTIADKAS